MNKKEQLKKQLILKPFVDLYQKQTENRNYKNTKRKKYVKNLYKIQKERYAVDL